MDQPPPLSPTAPPGRTSPLAIFALVMSCLFFVPLFPLIGLTLGIVALVRSRPGQPRGVAIAAVAVGPVAFFFLQGICAAIAIPSFMKYIRRSKVVEARLNVRRLANLAVQYQAEHARLPPAVDWTPAGSACGQEHNRFAPDPRAWSVAPWSDLQFSVDTPHYYQYRIETVGPGEIAVEARGDLDCNGTFSHFTHTVGPGGVGELAVMHELE
jgi:type II secretory pathway pseudopilin PulG